MMRSLGKTDLALLVIPHPFGGEPREVIERRAVEIADRLPAFIAELQRKAPAAPRPASEDIRPPEMVLDVAGDGDATWELERLELTDGLPVIAPTRERVARMLEYCDRPLSSTLGPIPPRYDILTMEAVAANCVMAGCRPEHFPVVLQSLEALLSKDDVNLYGFQNTTHPVGPMLIMGGPVAAELKVHGGSGCLGPCWPANATIGRAIRFLCLNAGGARPGPIDRATFGHPGKFTQCFAENEKASPWEPYRVGLGFSPETTTLTVVAAESPCNINDHGSTDAEGILRTIAGTIATTGNNNLYWLSDTFLAISPEHAHTLARGGLSRKDVQRELHRRARVPVAAMSEGQFAHLYSRILDHEKGNWIDSEGKVPLVREPKDIHIVVAGGEGKHSVSMATSWRSVTVPLVTYGGTAVASIEEFRTPVAAPA